ncbi:hypothetical protein [Algoriphagus machipongonensis]|uniref:Uncharacterized protein n=1 Tax=Algoriphagus machipongonensis TaxID=388413 RepID=A3I0E1_9BACT|nr:hypothetical protein [Algoriphagus machipongonensis]EAZ79937.1 hypothetical protein ALPR1_14949 [Algoriphagus machipongonensis]
MNLLFSRNYRYIVRSSVDNVRIDITGITDKPWHDFSENITGSLNDDNSFKFTHKWTFAYITWFENSFAYLTGTIRQEGEKTIINTNLRPNSGIVLSFYVLLVLFLCVLFGIQTMLKGPKIYILLFLLFFALILVGLMLYMTNGLRNRFERIMQLKRDE